VLRLLKPEAVAMASMEYIFLSFSIDLECSQRRQGKEEEQGIAAQDQKGVPFHGFSSFPDG